VSQADDVSARPTTGVMDEAFHYTSSQWVEGITQKGLRPGTYATPNGTLGGRVRSAIPTVADDFIGPTIGRSGYRTTAEFSDAVFARYQQFYDQADVIAQARVAAGRWPNDPTIIGARMDAIARSRVQGWLASEQIAEGPGGIIQVNRWLRNPTGSGLYRIPDIRIAGANTIFDGTIGWKGATTPQVVDFHTFSGGDNVIIVRPTRLGGSYGIWFP
jgi:hypothetical protein